MEVIWTKKVCFCFAADEQTESRRYTGAVTDTSYCTSDYPTGDSNGPGRKQSLDYWIRKDSGGSWKDFVLSRKLLSAKENQRICSDRKAWISLQNSIFSCTLS